MKLLFSLSCVLLLWLSPRAQQGVTDLTWHTDLKVATVLAEQSGRLMLVVFR